MAPVIFNLLQKIEIRMPYNCPPRDRTFYIANYWIIISPHQSRSFVSRLILQASSYRARAEEEEK